MIGIIFYALGVAASGTCFGAYYRWHKRRRADTFVKPENHYSYGASRIDYPNPELTNENLVSIGVMSVFWPLTVPAIALTILIKHGSAILLGKIEERIK